MGDEIYLTRKKSSLTVTELFFSGDGGKLIVMRLNVLEEYMTDLITWQQKVDDLLLHPDAEQSSKNDKIQPTTTSNQDCISKRPHWEPRTKNDLRSDVIGMTKVNPTAISSVKDCLYIPGKK